MKFESFGISEIYNIIQSMFTEDSDERGVGYNDGLVVFEADVLPLL